LAVRAPQSLVPGTGIPAWPAAVYRFAREAQPG
jgi:hypothetical protein